MLTRLADIRANRKHVFQVNYSFLDPTNVSKVKSNYSILAPTSELTHSPD